MPKLPYGIALPYNEALSDFAPHADSLGSFFLDSSLIDKKCGRYSFWGTHPLNIFSTKDGFVTYNQHTKIGTPLTALKELYQKIINLPFDPYFPFGGGLVGFLGYEWGTALENIETAPETQDLHLPDSWFGIYDTIVGYDHLEKVCWVASLGLKENFECNEELAQERAENLATQMKSGRAVAQKGGVLSLRVAVGAPNKTPQPTLRATLPFCATEFRSSFEKANYIRAIEKIMDYLRAGDCYQVNLSQRFMAPAKLEPWQQYLLLREISPAPYTCFLQCGNFQILSSSPECFLQSKADGTLITKPIKGTRGRGSNPDEDQKLKEELLNSSKDQAELLMITDLERNDFGKVCEPGSVEVPELRTIETFAQVHHLLSTVKGKRREELNIIDCLAACMPGGSITGAPKIRAMEIIAELEPTRRGIYTGAIGWMGPTNTAHFNIAIRTMVLQEATAYFNAGGGIVIDSDPEKEFEETLTKAKGMMESLGL
ncbi:MAG: aminodeoxychorismate synthase, component I [Deltaproteobacteria bacterium RIFCSPLOWO2_12_FULL_44_12]|nr:MAG: aminodeoxychorismate synthase, component I [Deltaproteobacteria bacterium RIFCSPHIGHO2_01_FULL_43_49]OGQ14542.1 MAG: aminodeoxychorismate synthase, component I [Deltaproteobacteria bacterium RIFCSPHIGHO2_02_FULL_44_53]OGQ27928.1 MAG: aminodeoxychorismate synthase, component I [Deltaproteobacteria bacterium RIFCSPHIGHO2_12_FULL_44_21]OGQ31140.1 MAG: aminodeoxychorismate synthase, component I [Deltaproteobacteria bacterium RIFCSPLOWO2_01_FULL_45_74]OGQ43132.1 MAG: aminodeoxychorismate syn